MNDLIEFLSGEVPGGFLLFLLILFIINLSLFFFYKGSKFYSREVYKRKVIRSSAILIALYLTLWFMLKPAKLPDSVLIIPFQNGSEVDYTICEVLEQQIENNLSNDYRLHRWDWFYQTCNKDSINIFEYRMSIANRLKIDLVFTGEINSDKSIKVVLKNKDKYKTEEFEFASINSIVIKINQWIDNQVQILNKKDIDKIPLTDDFAKMMSSAKLLYLKKEYNKALNLIDKIEPEPVILKSKIYLEIGKKEIIPEKSAIISSQENNYFNKIKNLLIPIAKENKDTGILNEVLGKLYLFEEKYKEAEIFFKKALTQNPYDSRIFYNLYYLHTDRYEDLGYKDRFEVLQKAIELDNGYADAIYNLANDYFQTGTGIKSGTGTTFALDIINKFMKINNSNEKILNLYAGINLQIKHPEKAAEVYKQLLDLGNNESELYYNLGIAYFHLKKYEEAEKIFLKSIELNDYPDSYLYIGAINKIIGNYDKALYYYRERIKRSKKGQDDYYAKEALHGLQWILKKQYEDSLNEKK